MKFVKTILVLNLVSVLTLSACGGSSGKSEQPGPIDKPVDPVDPVLPIVGPLKQSEVCKNFERKGIITSPTAESGDKTVVKISISNPEGQSASYECLGTVVER